MGTRMERYGTPAAIAAAVSLVVGAVGAATAARLITGAQVRDGSLTGADIRDGSISGIDVKDGSITRADLRKGTLLRGPAGPAGLAGPAGPRGEAGPAGSAAHLSARTVTRDAVSAPLGTSPADLATLALEPGAYLLLARASFSGADPGAINGDSTVTCRLRVGGYETTGLTSINDTNGADGALTASLSLHLTESVSVSTNAALTCSAAALASDPATVTPSRVVLTAVRLGGESHAALPS